MMTDAPTDAPAPQGGENAAGPAPAGPMGDSLSSTAAARVVVVTGMSGAGKTLALKSLEDLGYEAVDNLPLSLLGSLVRPGELQRPLAIGIDIRTRDFGVVSMLAEMDRLMATGKLDMHLVFVDCDDEVLRRRYTETRRRHPLAVDRPLIDGIRHDWEEGDLVVVDHWAWHQHFNSDPDLTARLIRVHNFSGPYDAMRALLDPMVLEEEEPNSEPDVATVIWPPDRRPE